MSSKNTKTNFSKKFENISFIKAWKEEEALDKPNDIIKKS